MAETGRKLYMPYFISYLIVAVTIIGFDFTCQTAIGILPLSCWAQIYPAFANSVDPDQLASEESALFAIKYLSL